MSAANPNATKIFGIRLGIDPKILVGGLVALALLLYWYNSRVDESDAVTSTPQAAAPAGAAAGGQNAGKTLPSRRAGPSSDRGVLRMRAVDATKGDVDPILHLGLLSRLSQVKEGKIVRSLFEIGPSPQSAAAATQIKAPKITVAPLPQTPTGPVASVPPPVNIPLKYYGYAKPEEKTEANRGLFLDDANNVVVASEGQTVKGHYLVVELTPKSARVEDTQVRQGKSLPVVPVAQPQ